MSKGSQGDENPMLREKDIKQIREDNQRRATIEKLTNKACDRNDEALRRLSKN